VKLGWFSNGIELEREKKFPLFQGAPLSRIVRGGGVQADWVTSWGKYANQIFARKFDRRARTFSQGQEVKNIDGRKWVKKGKQ